MILDPPAFTKSRASVKKAEEQGITVFASEEPVFDTALEIYRMISGDGGL